MPWCWRAKFLKSPIKWGHENAAWKRCDAPSYSSSPTAGVFIGLAMFPPTGRKKELDKGVLAVEHLLANVYANGLTIPSPTAAFLPNSLDTNSKLGLLFGVKQYRIREERKSCYGVNAYSNR